MEYIVRFVIPHDGQQNKYNFLQPSISSIKEFNKFIIEYQEVDCDNRIIGDCIRHLSQEEFIKYVENPYSLYYTDQKKKW